MVQMEIYVHRSTKERIELRHVDGSAAVGDAIGITEGEWVWIEGGEQAIDSATSFSEAGVGERGHVHVNTCHKVVVTVTYNNDPKERVFPPAAAIRAVFEWATGPKGFDLSEEDKAELVLQVCGTDDRLDPSE